MTDRPDPAEELEILFPDVELTVRDPDTGEDVTLTMREFRFRESLEAQALARPLIEALAELVAEDEDINAGGIAGILGEHADLWLTLAGRACGRDPEWLARLSDADGEAVSEAMWSANSGFFSRRVAVAAARKRTQSDSRRSSTPSSGPDTDGGTPT